MRYGKAEAMRRELGAIWQAYNRGESVPRVWVAGVGQKPQPATDWVYDKWKRDALRRYHNAIRWPEG